MSRLSQSTQKLYCEAKLHCYRSRRIESALNYPLGHAISDPMASFSLQYPGEAEASLYSAGSVLVIFATVLAWRWFSRISRTSHFPFLGKETGNTAQKRQYFLQNAQKVFQEGYQRVRLRGLATLQHADASQFRTCVWRTISTDGMDLFSHWLLRNTFTYLPQVKYLYYPY